MTNKQYIDTVLVSTSKEIIKQCDLERYSYHWDKMLESEALIKDFHETCEKCGVAYHNKSAILWYL